jgi:hypothetical protein
LPVLLLGPAGGAVQAASSPAITMLAMSNWSVFMGVPPVLDSRLRGNDKW